VEEGRSVMTDLALVGFLALAAGIALMVVT
jgi:hypothetical protein